MLGRALETGSLEGVLTAVRDGLSGVLVLRGEAGAGKTALLDWAAGQAAGMQVARVAGAEAEMGTGFAGLHQLLVPFLGGFDGLPAPQRQALELAFGLVAGPPPDRFLVGLAALTVLSDVPVWRHYLGAERGGFHARPHRDSPDGGGRRPPVASAAGGWVRLVRLPDVLRSPGIHLVVG